MISCTPEELSDFRMFKDILETMFSSPGALNEVHRLDKLVPGVERALRGCMGLLTRAIEYGATNSSNSSMPPSADPTHAVAASAREKSGNRRRKPADQKDHPKRKPGGQPGHKGTTLEPVEHTNVIKVYKPDNLPEFAELAFVRTCQTTGMRLVIETTEHRFLYYKDPMTGKIYAPQIPGWLNLGRMTYDPQVKASIVELSVGQMLPYRRLCELFRQDGLTLSEGSVNNFIRQGSELLSGMGFTTFIQEQLRQSGVLHGDETFTNLLRDRAFIHVLANPDYALFHFDRTRGHEAHDKMGVLPSFTNTLACDYYVGYGRYDCERAFCHAHTNRDLEGGIVRDGYQWPRWFLKLFGQLKERVEANGILTEEEMRAVRVRYRKLLTRAWNEMGIEFKEGARANSARSKSHNLLKRLEKEMEGLLLFCHKEGVPYTNNLAERALRMIKVHDKVSNCFRSEKTAEAWCLLRSFQLTCKNHQIPWRKALEDLFQGKRPSFMPPDTTARPEAVPFVVLRLTEKGYEVVELDGKGFDPENIPQAATALQQSLPQYPMA